MARGRKAIGESQTRQQIRLNFANQDLAYEKRARAIADELGYRVFSTFLLDIIKAYIDSYDNADGEIYVKLPLQLREKNAPHETEKCNSA